MCVRADARVVFNQYPLVPVPVAAQSPSFFCLGNNCKTGGPILQDASQPGWPVVLPASVVYAGDWLTLYVTGIAAADDVAVEFPMGSGNYLKVLAAPASWAQGVWQVNVQIPANSPGVGGAASLLVTAKPAASAVGRFILGAPPPPAAP